MLRKEILGRTSFSLGSLGDSAEAAAKCGSLMHFGCVLFLRGNTRNNSPEDGTFMETSENLMIHQWIETCKL